MTTRAHRHVVPRVSTLTRAAHRVLGRLVRVRRVKGGFQLTVRFRDVHEHADDEVGPYPLPAFTGIFDAAPDGAERAKDIVRGRIAR